MTRSTAPLQARSAKKGTTRTRVFARCMTSPYRNWRAMRHLRIIPTISASVTLCLIVPPGRQDPRSQHPCDLEQWDGHARRPLLQRQLELIERPLEAERVEQDRARLPVDREQRAARRGLDVRLEKRRARPGRPVQRPGTSRFEVRLAHAGRIEQHLERTD